MEPFVGEVRCFGFSFAPRGYMFCNGQLLQIAVYQALFTILGTTYGGDGRTTFGLPNLQGQIPMHWGNGPGGFNTVIGEVQGTTTITLTTNTIPLHNHVINAAAIAAGGAPERSATPTTASFISNIKGGFLYQPPPVTANSPFSPKAIAPTGNSQPHNNMQPYLTLNFCIAFEGMFPSRN